MGLQKKLVPALIVIILLVVGGFMYLSSRPHTATTVTADNLNSAKQGIVVQETPEDIITKLDENYWQAVKFNDYASAYDFFQPSDQALISKSDYVQKENSFTSVPISDIKVDSVLVQGNTATVRVIITNSSGSYPGTDNYALVNGKWYRVMSENNKESLGLSSPVATP